MNIFAFFFFFFLIQKVFDTLYTGTHHYGRNFSRQLLCGNIYLIIHHSNRFKPSIFIELSDFPNAILLVIALRYSSSPMIWFESVWWPQCIDDEFILKILNDKVLLKFYQQLKKIRPQWRTFRYIISWLMFWIVWRFYKRWFWDQFKIYFW